MTAPERRVRVLFLPHPAGPRMFHPWGADVLAALAGRHDVAIFDAALPVDSQFAGVEVVIDHGGAAGTRELADAATDVRLWQILGTGFDHFDLQYWRARKIPVANCPGWGSGAALADCAMMLILMLSRAYPTARENVRNQILYEPVGRELDGLRLVIVGFGASGQALARRARAFGMTLSAIDPLPIDRRNRTDFDLALAGDPSELDDHLQQADVVSLHMHLDPTTKHLFGASRLACMRHDAWLINVSRGELIDEAALVDALRNGRLGGAGLDVFAVEPPARDSPLWKLPNVVATPHIAGVTDGTSRRRARIAADNVERIAAGLEPLHRIDGPAVE